MAEDTKRRRDCALEEIVNAASQDKHAKSEDKKTILKAVSALRSIFCALKKDIVDKSAKT
jgi:hypothetical protein